MGCGKSKHDVVSGNTTVLQRKKSSVSTNAGQENLTETEDKNNNNVVDNVNCLGVEVEQKESESVASGNTTVLKSSAGSNAEQENLTEAKDKNNNNVAGDVNSSGVEVEQKESESVKEFEVKNDDVNDVKEKAEETNVQEVEKEADFTQETTAVEGNSEKSEGEKDYSLKENDQKVNDAEIAGAAEEKKPEENVKEDVSVKEETLAKEEEGKAKETNVSTSEGEEKDLKAEEGQIENPTSS